MDALRSLKNGQMQSSGPSPRGLPAPGLAVLKTLIAKPVLLSRESRKLKHWRGVWSTFGLRAAPVLGFGIYTSPCNAETYLAAFRDLLVVGLRASLGVKLLFDMNNHIKFPGMIRGGQECYGACMLPKLSSVSCG